MTEPRPNEQARPAKVPEEIVRAVRAADDKKAADLVVLDLVELGAFTDYFVLCSGQNARQVQAIADGVLEALRASGVRPNHVEGYERAEWVLIDYFDFIVHIFNPHTRVFYALERLWGNALRVPVDLGAKTPGQTG
jgi:ribosome-associated protein